MEIHNVDEIIANATAWLISQNIRIIYEYTLYSNIVELTDEQYMMFKLKFL
jgi:hypothetical protein